MRLTEEEARRAAQERNLWLATARPDGRPHLVPVWFATVDDAWFVCVNPNSVKARNLQAEPRCTWSLENGDDALVLEGTARPVKPSEAVIAAFRAKYNWNIDTDPEYSLLLELTPTRKVMGKTVADC